MPMWRDEWIGGIPFLLGMLVSLVCLTRGAYGHGSVIPIAAGLLTLSCIIGLGLAKKLTASWYVCATAALLFTNAGVDWMLGENRRSYVRFYDVLDRDRFGDPFLISFSIIVVVGVYYLILYRCSGGRFIDERTACAILATYLYCYSFFTIPSYLPQPAVIGSFRLLMEDRFYSHQSLVIHLTGAIVSFLYGLFVMRLLSVPKLSRTYTSIVALACLHFAALHSVLLVFHFVYAPASADPITLVDLVYLMAQFFLNFLLSSGVAYSLILLWHRYRQGTGGMESPRESNH